MFKKRNVKGSVMAKPIRRDSESSSSDEESIVIKKQKKVSAEESHDDKSKSDVSDQTQITLTRNNDATRVDTLNQELIDKDRERKSKEASDKDKEDHYATAFIKPKANGMDKIGPKKASSNIRSTTVFDFQRDVCKDYRLTGFCGYGDSCKFLHARDDFKAGWKLNTDWDLETKNKLEKELDGIPFKCAICSKDYKEPIKTKCDHYFCESCFLNRSKKTLNCLICGKNTNGVALPAKNLKKLLHTQKLKESESKS